MKKCFRYSIIFLLAQLIFALNVRVQSQSSRFVNNYSNAQQFMEDVMGRPIYLKVEYNVEGTPFYPEEYYRANIYLRYGKIYTGIYVKFNLQENLVLFKLNDETEMSATVPIKQIVFTDTSRGWIMYNTVFENGFPAIDKQSEETYYEVLDSGKVKLLKYHAVSFTDKKYYGQASITRVFDQREIYYVCLPDRVMKKAEKGKEAFVSLFTDKKEELKQFIDQNKIKCRKEDDWKKVIAYYNSLFKNS